MCSRLFREGVQTAPSASVTIEPAMIHISRERVASAATPGGMREFVEQYVGPMVLKTDGTVAQKETTPDGTEVVVKRQLAGARSWPLHIKAAFWERLAFVA